MRGAVLCAVLAAMVPASAGAQSISLTEREAMARLSSDGPRVRALLAPVDVARADVLAASRWPNPRVSVERQAVAGVTEYCTSVSQPLPITGRRSFEVQAADALVLARSRRAADDVRRLRADLRLAFAHLVAAQARERELTTSRDRLRELSQVLARRENAGDAAGFDRLRAEREVLDIESDLVIAATERAMAQARLTGFLGDGIDASRLLALDRSDSPPPVPAWTPSLLRPRRRAASWRRCSTRWRRRVSQRAPRIAAGFQNRRCSAAPSRLPRGPADRAAQ